MAFLNSIENIRDIEWGKTYLWDVRFPDAPAPFKEWFPAIEVEENIANIESHIIEGHLSSFKIPKSTNPLDIKLMFLDNMNGALIDWLTDWINSIILNDNNRVSTLDESIKQIDIIKLNSQRETIKTSSYLVYPEGQLYYRGTNESSVPLYQLELNIAGVLKREKHKGHRKVRKSDD